MRHLYPSLNLYRLPIALLIVGFMVGTRDASAADVIQLTEKSWDDAVPQGKEVDCIYGDWVLRNKQIVAVIAEALPKRNANMTVRNVGGCVIDLTERSRQSDQLSAYYPLNGQYALTGPDDAEKAGGSGAEKTLTFRGTSEDKRSTAEVIYALADDAHSLKIITRIKNVSAEPLELNLADAIRADGEFEFGTADDLGLFWAYDPYWRQGYGAMLLEPKSTFSPDAIKRGDKPVLSIKSKDAAAKLAPGETREVVRHLFPAANLIEVLALARELHKQPLVTVDLAVKDPDGVVVDADVEIKNSTGERLAHGRTSDKGRLAVRLPAGEYQAQVSALGQGSKAVTIYAERNASQTVELPPPGYVDAKITSPDGGITACKVQFSGRGDTKSPKFGPDSAVHGVRNVYYTENGKFRVPLAPGEYDVIVSYGPEYDAVFTTIKVAGGKVTPLAAQLKRSVDTTGWLSADFHSHSTPSGDNTASQAGRVLNLLAEHVEFAPCTEHNRITVYDPHLKAFDAVKRMLTCPGMEMTGRPLPLNHQNAFPLTPHPRTQDNGAPLSDVDPVVQIERLAMWENNSDKLVQVNHPNIVQMAFDKDLNGSPDGGFEKMFGFMDVIEVHPLPTIFTPPESVPNEREQGNTIFHWLQLLNLGYRVPGVVNTDAHWNFHGSGGLRNFIKSSTDVPAEASVMNLVHACEHGNIVMTNGPFLTVHAKAGEGNDTALVGEDLQAPGGKLTLAVRVQCPNWLEVNRVQIFVNGVADPKWNYSRRTHADKFHQATVVFDEELPIELPADAHLVVVAAGEGKELGPVVGPDQAKQMPTAVANPIFVDVDGGGFKPNGDMLGLPLPVGPDFKPSKPHKHEHKH
ncbi:MAG TPA: CehA/McbA family metallohydrolase [Pirellulales bacterium]|nr:CehA/McbA family metallohydrolase [Pirellulales bacterium]